MGAADIQQQQPDVIGLGHGAGESGECLEQVGPRGGRRQVATSQQFGIEPVDTEHFIALVERLVDTVGKDGQAITGRQLQAVERKVQLRRQAQGGALQLRQ